MTSSASEPHPSTDSLPAVLVTGASGLVGRRLAVALPQATRTSRTQGVCTDLLDLDTLEPLARHWDTVVHTASVLPDFEGDPVEPNVRMVDHLLQALEPTPPGHIVHVSSVSVYAIDPSAPRIHLVEDAALGPGNPYGVSKLLQEERMTDWCSKHDVKLTILRLSGVYGVGQRAFGALPVFWNRSVAGKTIEVFAPRAYRQNYIAASDVAAVCAKVAQRRIEGTFNVFSDETMDMASLATRVCTFTGKGRVVDNSTSNPYPHVDFDRSRLDAALAHRFLTLEEGLQCLM